MLIGNIIGGGLFVGTYYWWMYLCGSPDLMVDGMAYETDTLEMSAVNSGVKRGDGVRKMANEPATTQIHGLLP